MSVTRRRSAIAQGSLASTQCVSKRHLLGRKTANSSAVSGTSLINRRLPAITAVNRRHRESRAGCGSGSERCTPTELHILAHSNRNRPQCHRPHLPASTGIARYRSHRDKVLVEFTSHSARYREARNELTAVCARSSSQRGSWWRLEPALILSIGSTGHWDASAKRASSGLSPKGSPPIEKLEAGSPCGPDGCL
jgi:hypothetical protein